VIPEATTAYERVLELAGTEPERALARDRLAEMQQTGAHADGI
jgi:RNA polymerase sigma-70 factor (ECF subfamily)